MASPAQRQATYAVFVAALLLGAPAHAALVVGADGKPVPRGTPRALLIGEGHGRACKVAPDRQVVAFNFPPDTKLVDAIAWISSVTCKSFLVRDAILAEHGPLTMIAPERITPNEAYRLFLGALDSDGLTVEPSGKFLRIIETARVLPPIVGAGTALMSSVVPEPYVTVLVRLKDLSPEQRRWVLRPQKVQGCALTVFPPETLVITDLRSNLEPLLGRPVPIPSR